MSMRLVGLGGLALATVLLINSSVKGGLYNTADSEMETRMSQDFGVFRSILGDLRAIPVPKPERDPPIRKRYVLMESLGRKGSLDLNTLEQQLNYSVVLIRRGKADEAAQMLLPLTRQHPTNFIVQSHSATAHFLASNEDFRGKSAALLKEALELWPKEWNDVDDEQKAFLTSIGWEETAFERNRRYESFLERLMRNRLLEEKRLRKKEAVPETVDPIFVDEQKKPLRFVNESGAFEVGRIPTPDHAQLPKDAVEAVEQLLIWMPHDERLLWLLGEVFNASAMDQQRPKLKNDAIKNAKQVFEQLRNDSFSRGRATYGRKEIMERYAVLSAAVEKMPRDQEIAPPEDPIEQWSRSLIVGFITGFAVGMFALWQFQEMRRRRQARAKS